MGTASRILIIGGGCGLLGLVGLLRDHGIDAITEDEYREANNPHHVTRRQVGLGMVGVGYPGDLPLMVEGVILPSLTAGMFLEYDPVVVVERHWHPHREPVFLRRDSETSIPHVRGTWLG